jgi:penicillin amidase
MDQLPEEQLSTTLQPYGGNQEMWSIFLLMQKPDDPWWDDATTKGLVEKRDDILARSFREGYAKTVAVLGKDRNRWKWGNLHTATFVSNPLGASGIGLIESVVNRGPVAVSGSSDTPNNTFWAFSRGSFDTLGIPSMRMIVDAGDFSRSVCINSTGQSGHPASPYYGNMIDSWCTLQYHPMLWTREQVLAAAVHKLVLNPAK